MSSQTDLDQGGTARQWVRTYLGPSVGWVYLPGLNPLPLITIAGTYIIQPDTTLVQVNCNGAVVIQLPTALEPTVPAINQGALFAKKPITIVDIGGFAALVGGHPIIINPASVAENIMGLTTISIQTAYGAYTLSPSNTQKGWTSISP